MRRTLFTLLLFWNFNLSAQVVWTEPAFPTQQDDITLFFDATEGNAGLEGYTEDVYAHMGLITNKSDSPTDWKYVQGTWGTEDANVLMTRVSDNLYSKSYNIAAFHGIEPGELVEQLAFVFRSGDGSIAGRATDGSDIYLEVFPPDDGLFATLNSPEDNTIIYLGETINIALQTNRVASVTIYDNNEQIFSAMVDEVDEVIVGDELGTHDLRIVIAEGMDTQEILVTYFVLEQNDIREPRPDWISPQGLTYDSSGNDYGIALTAPDKEHVFLLCPANDYKVDLDYRMHKTLEGDRFWIDLSRTDFANGNNSYQFLVDGKIKIADPYAEVVLDPWNDDNISAEVIELYAAYPEGLTTGLVTTFAPEENTYDWQVTNFERPQKEELVIYELLMRDFLEDKSYVSLLDTLDYLARLGVNAIELMPIQEFEGNNSWGYNPSFHNAIDKYYGSQEQFQQVVDKCHELGIAVILDVVFNHAFSQSPLCQLYWDATNFRPTADNPWLNVTARHPFNVGYDFNHESMYTKEWVKALLTRMMEDLNVDGFRFDLSKGFTQTNSNGNASVMSRYDQSRIDILSDYAEHIWDYSDDIYVIMEHFADADEERVLANKGMMLWSNTTFQYAEAAMGYSSDLTASSYKSRGFSEPSIIAYMESHDEERMGYKIKTWGNSTTNYNTKDPWTFAERIAATAAVYFSIPGPKMLWQFGELGYDNSINRCEDGTVNDNCRLSSKPIRWDFADMPHRASIYDKLSAMLYLRNNHEVFHTSSFSLRDDNFYKRIQLNGSDMNALTLANFNVQETSVIPEFQHTGIWYEYFTGEILDVSDVNAPLQLKAGEYRIYTTQQLTPPGGFFSSIKEVSYHPVSIAPNPVVAGETISIAHEFAAKARATLMNSKGQKIRSKVSLHSDSAILPSSILTIPEGVEPGIYYLTIYDDQQSVTSKIVVVNR